MKLLFLNALKGLKKKKVQMFGIIFMVMLSTAVYTGMNSAIDRLEDKYYSYLDEQNVEDISVGVNVDLMNDISVSDVDQLLNNELKFITNEEKNIIEQYKLFLKNPSYDVNMIYSVMNIFKKYDVIKNFEAKKLDELKGEYNFYYEREISKTVSDGKKLYKVIPYNENKKINRIYLVEGNYPINKNEITILPSFAKKNKIKIGDMYKIGEYEYKVVGFTYAPDYIYPLISFSMPIFDEMNNSVIYINDSSFNDIKGIDDNSYAIKYNNKVNRKFEISSNIDENSNMKDEPLFKIFNSDSIIMDMNTITRIGRIGALQLEFASNRLFAEYFMYLLLSISVLIIIIITKKRIDDEKLQIGVLKSLGYSRFSIAVSYLVYPIIGSLIGGVLGYIIGILVHEPIASILRSYYSVPLSNYSINLNYLKISVLVPMVILSILSYLIAFFMLRKKPLQLLKEGSNLKVNIFNRLFNKILKFLPFNLRFKYSLAFRSIGKLLIITITSFLTGLLITLILISYNLFNNVIDKSFAGIDYKYMVASNGLSEFNEKDDLSDYILSVTIPIEEISDKDGNKKKTDKKEDDISFNIYGIDTTAKYTRILDKNDKNIISLLDDKNGIIVNENAKELYGLEINDKIKFKYQDLILEYTIIGFNNELMAKTGYVERIGLTDKLHVSNNSYSMRYSNNSKYKNMNELTQDEASSISYLLSVDDLKANIEKQMDRFNGSIYIVIAFASIMALIIIAVIANIVIEENKKTISVMKVMGYSNKNISNIVLNIYTPFIIIAYLLSIPTMIALLKKIVSAIVGNIEITIPIEADPFISILGLLGLLVAYYVALYISKKDLNKVPLAVALKRE